MDILTLMLFGTFSGIISNSLVLYWFGKEIPMFFQVHVINRNTQKIALYVSWIATAIVYTIIILLIHLYIGYIKGNTGTALLNISIMEIIVEVFLGSFLFLGGRSLLYGKIVKNLNNKQLKIMSYE